jgi:predicted phosphodiesterase
MAGCQPTGDIQSVAVASRTPPAFSTAVLVTSISTDPQEPQVTTPAITPTAVIDYRPDEIEQSVAFLFPLTIQHLTTSSVTLHFELVEPRQGRLVLWPQGLSPAEAFVLPFDASSAQQIFVVDGLESGAGYVVGVAIEGVDGVFRSPHYFEHRWGPIGFTVPDVDPYPLRVGVIGDSGYGEQTTIELAALMASYDFDFVLHTGDLVYLAQNNLNPVHAFTEKFFLPFEPVLNAAPIYPVVGNHEHYPDVVYRSSFAYYAAFPRFPGSSGVISGEPSLREWYAFSYGDIQFVLLNTQPFFGYPGRGEQLAWLEERLSDPDFAASIVVFHVPPFTSGKHTPDGLAVQSDWVPLFESYGVPLVLSGHDHNYERLEHQGVTYIVTGGGSGVLYPQTINVEVSRIFSSQMHFVLLEIYADRIELSAIGLDGELFDRALIPLE